MRKHTDVRARTILCLALLGALLVGCGGAGESGVPNTSQEGLTTSAAASGPDSSHTVAGGARPLSIVTIGNSITLHLPDPSTGWNGTWGMAASSEATDYSSQLATLVSLSRKRTTTLKRFSLSHIEKEPSTHTPPNVITSALAADIVVIELGDNVDPSAQGDFQTRYRDLLRSVKSPSNILFCTSTYWPRTLLSNAIRTECLEAGGVFVDIGKIHALAGTDASYLVNTTAGVRNHPGDLGMKKIADTIHSELIKLPQ